MKVVFPYFAQHHQVFHSLPIAAELARRHPEVQVHAAGATASHVDFVRGLLKRYAPEAPVHVDQLKRPWFAYGPAKKRTMVRNLDYLSGFDAVVTPERTSLFLKKQRALRHVRLIWTRHGAGDRAIGFADDIAQFDYVLLAGRKIEQRLLDAGLVRPGHYTAGVYAKFDWLRGRAAPRRWFDNDRPTVLYNPHFEPTLSSWPAVGFAVLDFFAASDRYNLIFAPHVRLFDPPTPAKYRPFERYRELPHLRIDLGSVHCIDMSYVEAADVYLGDVSSQVAEFVARPRPCVFINSRRVNWRDDPDYAFWTLGEVIASVDELSSALETAILQPDAYAEAQWRYVDDTFGIERGAATAVRGADAIYSFLACPSATATQRTSLA